MVKSGLLGLSALVFAAFIPDPLSAEKRHHLYTNLEDLGRSYLTLAYERSLHPNHSLLANVSAGGRYTGGQSLAAAGGGLGWHLTTKPLGGWFAGPRFLYQFRRSEGPVSINHATGQPGEFHLRRDLHRLSLAGDAGYRWVFERGFVLGLGFSYLANFDQVTSWYDQTAYEGGDVGAPPNPLVNLTFGYAF